MVINFINLQGRGTDTGVEVRDKATLIQLRGLHGSLMVSGQTFHCSDISQKVPSYNVSMSKLLKGELHDTRKHNYVQQCRHQSPE